LDYDSMYKVKSRGTFVWRGGRVGDVGGVITFRNQHRPCPDGKQSDDVVTSVNYLLDMGVVYGSLRHVEMTLNWFFCVFLRRSETHRNNSAFICFWLTDNLPV
jgi:hypothetical protein